MAISSEQVRNNPIVVPDIDIENSGSDDVSTSTTYADGLVKTVEIAEGFTQVQLPNGFAYDAGDQVQLTQWEFDQISSAALGTVVTDVTA